VTTVLPKSAPTHRALFARWVTRKTFAVALAVVVLLMLGVIVAWALHARDTQQLTQSLQQVEQGVIPNEPPSYRETITRDLEQSIAPVLPGVYTNLTQISAVTYNAVLLLKPDGQYDYALTVGNDRLHKRYGHRGRWWVQGRVLHTVLLEGDAFLTAPASRNRVTPARERIMSSSKEQITLQAHYGPAVTFLRVPE
jgi:hypothetical protein